MNDFEIMATIPMGTIKSIEIYRNTNRRSLKQILEETGADYAINGTLYNLRDGKAVCPLRAKGVTDCKTAERYYGFAWYTGRAETFAMHVVPDDGYDNYIACTCLIHPALGSQQKPIYDSAMGGKRGRTAIGMNAAGDLMLYCSSDKGSAKKTPEQLRDFLAAQGWTAAVMLDGGASSQYRDSCGKAVSSTRKVPHCVLVYLKPTEEEKPEPAEEEKTEITPAREMLDLTTHCKSIIAIAKAANVMWTVAVDMFVANILNAPNEAAPYYPGADDVDYKSLNKVWCGMTLQERANAMNEFASWYRRQIQIGGEFR